MTGDWIDIGAVAEIPLRGARTVPVAGGEEIALFRTGDDRIFALVNRCPHKHGPLSQGIIHGHAVACPLHNWRISLETGEALGEDKGCVPTVPVRVDAGRILIARLTLLATAIAA
ncbi:nitrite reductase small subunit NirD [Sphingomonas montanisoli]|uniref:Nitrite reductase small subunit NirD n=1 Tax=Sphingomonas montanisoli TaxID=2606412 RepID=A0A5D9C979_9SPHN|nr:nitrite reductase small subunit NirD [Sphingomonas montanisoli]TZG26545.1 nitrite reductase small subunit NirD [Sphingomonas montanisoli]